jgi:hypothetical protein
MGDPKLQLKRLTEEVLPFIDDDRVQKPALSSAASR